MKTNRQNRILCFLLTAALFICLAGCVSNTAEPPPTQDEEPPIVFEEANAGIEGGDFAMTNSLSDSFSEQGNTTFTLTEDATVDLSGVSLIGRKELLLNGFTLKLTGQYMVTLDGVLDIKAGEGASGSALDLSELAFDTSLVPSDIDMELALIEIRPDIAFTAPQIGNGIVMQEFPGILTVVAYAPQA